MENILLGAFPTLMQKYPFKGSTFELYEIKEILEQSDSRFAKNTGFIFYCYDVLRRRAVSSAVVQNLKHNKDMHRSLMNFAMLMLSITLYNRL